jgi:hypothetical protein
LNMKQILGSKAKCETDTASSSEKQVIAPTTSELDDSNSWTGGQNIAGRVEFRRM